MPLPRLAAHSKAPAIPGARAAAPTKFGDVDDARLRNADREPQNWLAYSGNRNAWRHATLNQINVDTIKDLKPAWVLEFDTDGISEARKAAAAPQGPPTNGRSLTPTEARWLQDATRPGNARALPRCRQSQQSAELRTLQMAGCRARGCVAQSFPQ